MIKECKKCKHFVQHYVVRKSRRDFLLDTNCGHCLNKERINRRKPCPKFDEGESGFEKEKITLIQSILYIRSQCRDLISRLNIINQTIKERNHLTKE